MLGPVTADPEAESKPASKPSKRLLGLDALRGVAVFLMIEQHLGVWLWEGPAVGETMAHYPGLLVFNALGGGAAPAFVTLAGIGSSLLARKREQRGESPDLTLVLRGLALLGFGYLLSALTPSWFSARSWFVLHLMGVGMLTTPLWRRLPTPALLAAALAILGSAGALQAHFDVPLRLDNPYMSGRSPLSPDAWAGLRIATLEGQFPIFPWLSFFLAGLACGRWVLVDAEPREQAKELRKIAALGGGAIGLGLVGVALRYSVAAGAVKTTALARSVALTVPFFPASPTLAALLLGLVLLGIWALMAWDRWRPLGENHPLVTLGRASLTLLIVHVWLFRELTRVDGWWQEHVGAFAWLSQWTHAWHQLSVNQGFAVIGVFVVFAVFASRAWQTVDYRYGAEWLLRKVAR
ncbi:hypothetical protein PPSIR1_31513 [Plesiocystis pacifica SIR-1]|uniref:Heparan-alpha-glucosaminide N-acetyltransferase catalytic domain-containing protein n=1 Tax=Plesiocystis pacifica SIR-1 TaxID=391625 RepID=A6GF43_9BACT|nr:hypothetical protein PPSIR1_31513 [Plesiocystis pacifica SIR-1]